MKHSWLGFRRSPALKQDLLKIVLMGFLGFNILIGVVGASLAGGKLIDQFFLGRNVLEIAMGFILYYFLIDIFARYFFQKFPTLLVKPYLLLPIPRKRIASYLVNRSLLSFFNFIPIFLILPFFFMVVLPHYSVTICIGFWLVTVMLSVFNNFLVFWIAKGADLKNYYPYAALIVILVFSISEYYGYTHFFFMISSFGYCLIRTPLLWLLPVALAAGSYFWLRAYFSSYLTWTDDRANSSGFGFSLGSNWLSRYGKVGQLMGLEVKLIFRTKRSRGYLFLGLVILLIPLYLFTEDSIGPFAYILGSSLCTGVIAQNHGQLMLSWNSRHFDLLLSRGNSIHDIFKAKYYVLALTCLIWYLLMLPYYFVDPIFMAYTTAMLLVNASYPIFLYMLLASFNSKAIDPNEEGAFSTNGFGAAHYLIGIPVFLAHWSSTTLGMRSAESLPAF